MSVKKDNIDQNLAFHVQEYIRLMEQARSDAEVEKAIERVRKRVCVTVKGEKVEPGKSMIYRLVLYGGWNNDKEILLREGSGERPIKPTELAAIAATELTSDVLLLERINEILKKIEESGGLKGVAKFSRLKGPALSANERAFGLDACFDSQRQRMHRELEMKETLPFEGAKAGFNISNLLDDYNQPSRAIQLEILNLGWMEQYRKQLCGIALGNNACTVRCIHVLNKSQLLGTDDQKFARRQLSCLVAEWACRIRSRILLVGDVDDDLKSDLPKIHLDGNTGYLFDYLTAYMGVGKYNVVLTTRKPGSHVDTNTELIWFPQGGAFQSHQVLRSNFYDLWHSFPARHYTIEKLYRRLRDDFEIKRAEAQAGEEPSCETCHDELTSAICPRCVRSFLPGRPSNFFGGNTKPFAEIARVLETADTATMARDLETKLAEIRKEKYANPDSFHPPESYR